MARVNRTTGFFLVLGVMTLVGTVAGFGFMQQPAADSQQTSGPNENSVFAQGNVDVASGLAPLVPRMPGKVAAILVKEGDAVQKGQTLVQLDDQQQREELKIAEQGLQVSRAKLKGAKDAADKKAQEYELELAKAQAAVNTAEIEYKTAYEEWKRAKEY